MARGLLARLWPFRSDDGRANSVEDGGSDSPESTDDDPEDDGQVRTWDFIPAWQYDGWQVETGGLTVDEQESALSEIQSQAEAIEEAAADDERHDQRDQHD